MEFKFLEIKEASGESLCSPYAIANMMTQEARIDRECLWVIHLNAKNQVIEKELVSMGIVNSASVHPREVFRRAIICSSVGIVAVHNHPTGDPYPSDQDNQVYHQLTQAGRIIGIKLVDFLIIGPGTKFYSAAQGMVMSLDVPF